MILGKGVYGIHQPGKWYTNQNINQLFMERYLTKKARIGKEKNHFKGYSKRTVENDKHFLGSFEKLIAMAIEKNKKLKCIICKIEIFL